MEAGRLRVQALVKTHEQIFILIAFLHIWVCLIIYRMPGPQHSQKLLHFSSSKLFWKDAKKNKQSAKSVLYANMVYLNNKINTSPIYI